MNEDIGTSFSPFHNPPNSSNPLKFSSSKFLWASFPHLNAEEEGDPPPPFRLSLTQLTTDRQQKAFSLLLLLPRRPWDLRGGKGALLPPQTRERKVRGGPSSLPSLSIQLPPSRHRSRKGPYIDWEAALLARQQREGFAELFKGWEMNCPKMCLFLVKLFFLEY